MQRAIALLLASLHCFALFSVESDRFPLDLSRRLALNVCIDDFLLPIYSPPEEEEWAPAREPPPLYNPPLIDVNACDTWYNEPYPCDLFAFYPSVSSRLGNGQGYHRGYQSLEAFFALYDYAYNTYPFLDLRAHVLNNGGFAGNFGVGWREFSPTLEEMFGVNLYYDCRKIPGGWFNQYGAGVEALGFCGWDLRANAYIPFGNEKSRAEITTFHFPGDFFAIRHEFKTTLWRFELEVGRQLNMRCLDVYVAAGPYLLGASECGCGSKEQFFGGMGRLSIGLCDCISLDLYASHDCIYNTRGQVQLTFGMPFPRALECCSYLFSPPERQEIIPTKKTCTFKTNY